MAPKVNQPGNSAGLTWSPTFAGRRGAQFTAAQKFVDSEVIRYCDPLTPKRTGALIRSATLGTVIGSGEVRQIAPYAHTQYYETAQSRLYDPRRGSKWFERMKASHKEAILKGVKHFRNG